MSLHPMDTSVGLYPESDSAIASVWIMNCSVQCGAANGMAITDAAAEDELTNPQIYRRHMILIYLFTYSSSPVCGSIFPNCYCDTSLPIVQGSSRHFQQGNPLLSALVHQQAQRRPPKRRLDKAETGARPLTARLEPCTLLQQSTAQQRAQHSTARHSTAPQP